MKKIVLVVLVAIFVASAGPVFAQTEDGGPLNGTFTVSAENAGSLQFFKTPTMLVYGTVRYSMLFEELYTTPEATFRVCVEGEVEQATRIFVSALDGTDIATQTLTDQGEDVRDDDWSVPPDSRETGALITLSPSTRCADIWVLLKTLKDATDGVEITVSIIVK